jgi:hypothetical protein
MFAWEESRIRHYTTYFHKIWPLIIVRYCLQKVEGCTKWTHANGMVLFCYWDVANQRHISYDVIETFCDGGHVATVRTVRGSNPGGEEVFRTCPDRPWGPHSSLYNWYRVSFKGVKRPELGVNNPLPSHPEVKERVELYVYSLSGCSWPVLRWTLSFRSGHVCTVNPYMLENFGNSQGPVIIASLSFTIITGKRGKLLFPVFITHHADGYTAGIFANNSLTPEPFVHIW